MKIIVEKKNIEKKLLNQENSEKISGGFKTTEIELTDDEARYLNKRGYRYSQPDPKTGSTEISRNVCYKLLDANGNRVNMDQIIKELRIFRIFGAFMG